MGDDRAAAEQARHRLVRLGGHGTPPPGSPPPGSPPPDGGRDGRLAAGADPGATGWVPQDPTLEAAHPAGDGPALRRRAMSAALVGYTAAHGHPLEHRDLVPGGRTRWAPTVRQVLVAAAALVALVVALVLRTGLGLPSTTVETTTVETTTVETGTVEAGTVETGSGATPGADAAGDTPAGPSPSASAPVGAPGPTLVVHVVGEVLNPGLLTLPEGARVADAVTAAGGALPTADLTAINLARLLVDGEQLVVPEPGVVVTAPAGPGPGGAPGGPGPARGPAGLVDLNSADLAALDGLPGIGPVLAQRVLDWRTEHGRFTSVEELTEVAGIGPSLLDGLRDLVRV